MLDKAQGQCIADHKTYGSVEARLGCLMNCARGIDPVTLEAA